MSVGSNAVKVKAKDCLKGSFLKAVAASSIFIFSWLVCSNLAGLLSIVTGEIIGLLIYTAMILCLLLPLFLGVVRYIWRIVFYVTDNPVAVFYWFSNKKAYLRSLGMIFQFVLKIALWLTVLNIPSLVLYTLSKSFVFDLLGVTTPLWTAHLQYYSTLLLNFTVIVVTAIMLKFYMAPILLAADENMDVSEAMYTSSVISRKSSIDFIGLVATSVGWILISFFVLPLPITLPLLLTYYAVHVSFAVEEYNQHIEKNNSQEMEFL